MAKDQITYLFGAGASAKSMPVVENLPKRFQGYLIFLLNSTLDRRFIQENQDFLREIESHQSIDTLFKKLFHKKQKGIREQIVQYKWLFALYLLYEQIATPEIINNNLQGTTFNKPKSNFTDPRYEALIAGLLQPIMGKQLFIHR